MKGKESDIEQLFQESFKDFKAEVPADAWANVQQGLQMAAGTGSSAAGAAKSGGWLAAKIPALIVGATVVAGSLGVWAYLDDAPNANDVAPVAEKIEKAEGIETTSVQPSEDVQTGNPEAETHQTIQEKTEEDKASNQVTPKSDPLRGPTAMLSPSGNDRGGFAHLESGDEQKKPAVESHKGDQKPGEPQVEQKDPQTTPTEEITDRPPVVAVGMLANPISGQAPLTVSFSTANYAGSASRLWDFNYAGEMSVEMEPSFVYEEAGTYRAKLTTWDKEGRKIEEVVTINVEEPSIETVSEQIPAPNTDLPNVFTPNFDGNNDYFTLSSADHISELELRIFAPDGKQVYKTNDPAFRWDGADQRGQLLPSGTYFGQLEVLGKDGNRYRNRTAITLFRE